MNKRKIIPFGTATVVIVIVVFVLLATRQPHTLALTGMVTTDEVIVASEIQGRLQNVFVQEGDSVTNGEVIARLRQQTEAADLAYYASSEKQSASQVTQAEATLKFQQAQTSNQIAQAEANLAAAEAQTSQAVADLENARLTFERAQRLNRTGVESQETLDRARTAFDAAQARLHATEKQAEAAQTAVGLARANAELIGAQKAALDASIHKAAAATAQIEKAKAQLAYTEIRAPLDGIVDTRAALPGEVVGPGKAIVTLIDPDNLWVRADLEETYIERVHLGDRLEIRLPSGDVREGTVFYRSVDADYATQRDVGRTKRDIKTFEIRLRCDNKDRSLAVGMTATVLLPVKRNTPAG